MYAATRQGTRYCARRSTHSTLPCFTSYQRLMNKEEWQKKEEKTTNCSFPYFFRSVLFARPPLTRSGSPEAYLRRIGERVFPSIPTNNVGVRRKADHSTDCSILQLAPSPSSSVVLLYFSLIPNRGFTGKQIKRYKTLLPATVAQRDDTLRCKL